MERNDIIINIAHVIADVPEQEWGGGQTWQDPADIAEAVVTALEAWGVIRRDHSSQPR